MAISLQAQKPALKDRPRLGFKYTFSQTQMFIIILVLRPLYVEDHHRFVRTMEHVVY